MKTLKNIIILVTIIIGALTLAACTEKVEPDNPSSNNPSQDTNISSESVLDSIKKLNNRVNDLTTKIDSLETINGADKNNINGTEGSIEKLEKSKSIFALITFCIVAISLILAIIALVKAMSVNARASRHRQEIERLKLQYLDQNKNPKTNITYLEQKYKGLYNSLREYISSIEVKLAQQNNPKPHNDDSPPKKGAANPSPTTQSGYFGLPSQMSKDKAYFNKLLDFRDSDARFEVTIRGDKAEFTPIEGTQYLNDIKSNDIIKMALAFTGCAPNEATQMKILNRGEVQKEGGRWIITKKAIIELSK